MDSRQKTGLSLATSIKNTKHHSFILQQAYRKAGDTKNLSRACKVSAKTIEKWLSGHFRIPAKRLKQLVEIINSSNIDSYTGGKDGYFSG